MVAAYTADGDWGGGKEKNTHTSKKHCRGRKRLLSLIQLHRLRGDQGVVSKAATHTCTHWDPGSVAEWSGFIYSADCEHLMLSV